MNQLQSDLGTELNWVAADHVDTAHPHTHILIRGKDERGQNLVIAPEYIKRGMRERLTELITLDLGPRTVLETELKLRREIGAERLTSIDRALIRNVEPEGNVSARHRDPFHHALRAGRLKKLEALGLALPVVGDQWRIADDVEERLRELGQRGDIVRTMQRAFKESQVDRGPSDRVIHGGRLSAAVVGRVLERGLLDEVSDRHYLIVDGVDGRAHHLDIGRGDSTEMLPRGALIRLLPADGNAREADRTIADIAAHNDGQYSIPLHLQHDLGATRAFAEAHVRRLEAIRRGTGGVERLEDGSWKIAPDHLERVEAFEARRLRRRPVAVEVLSPLPLEHLTRADGATWLDRLLVEEDPEPLRDSGFGRDVRGALVARRQWLIDEQLAVEEEGGETRYRRNLLVMLQRRELLRVAAALSDELLVSYTEAQPGMRISGRLERRLDLASGRFALLVGNWEFTLVPWREDMTRHIGRNLDAKVSSGGISWSLGRGRSGPEIG